MNDPHSQSYFEIGIGSAGVVFEKVGVNEVLKKAVTDNWAENIWHDFKLGKSISEKFNIVASWEGDEASFPRVPRYHHFYNPNSPQSGDWWRQNQAKFPAEHQRPAYFLTAERIPPLARPMRETLIDKYCHPAGVAAAKASRANTHCLARLYLGRKRFKKSPSLFFSLRNYPLHLDQALDICPAEIHRFAQEMGRALAVMHWLAACDANDVEFVLGSAPTLDSFSSLSYAEAEQLPECSTTLPAVQYDNVPKRPMQLWVVDFDKAKKMKYDMGGIQQAIKAAEDNDPYYPKPGLAEGTMEQDLWVTFGRSYYDTSNNVIERRGLRYADDLPAAFLNGWDEYRKAKVAKRTSDGGIDEASLGATSY